MKKIFTILLLSVCFVSVPSCQKDSNGKGDDPKRLSAKEAKEFFEQHSTCLRFLSVGGDKPSGTKSALTENMIIDWDSAIECETSDAYFVEVPINMASPISAIMYDGLGKRNTKIKNVTVKSSLLIERQKKEGLMSISLVTMVGLFANNQDTRWCVSCNKDHFNGYQIFSKTNGDILCSYYYHDGIKEQRTLYREQQITRIDAFGRDLPLRGITFIVSNYVLTRGGGGGASGESTQCPSCGATINVNNIQNGYYQCPPPCGAYFLVLIDPNLYCEGCGFPFSECRCCNICHYYPCSCNPPGGNDCCPICGVPGCNGQCGGGADSTVVRPGRCLITVNVNNSSRGYVTMNPESYLYDIGENLTLTAYAYSGFSFAGWYENGLLISHNSTLGFMVSQDRTFLAVFEEN